MTKPLTMDRQRRHQAMLEQEKSKEDKASQKLTIKSKPHGSAYFTYSHTEKQRRILTWNVTTKLYFTGSSEHGSNQRLQYYYHSDNEVPLKIIFPKSCI